MKTNTYICHVDGDSFFASCEVARLPHLRGKPVVIGQERGVVTALTKEAKDLGIKRGDPLFQVKNQHKNVTILPANFELYKHYSRSLSLILSHYSENVEVYSIDECFFEVSFPENASHDEIYTWLAKLQGHVHLHLGITYSFGIATTKTLAKVASKLSKPVGCVVLIKPQLIEHILKQTSISDVWGVGRQFSKKLICYDINTAYDFTRLPDAALASVGAPQPLRDTRDELCGIKKMNVSNRRDISAYHSMQSTRLFVRSTDDIPMVISELSRHCEILSSRMVREKLFTKKISWFVRIVGGARPRRVWFESDMPAYTQNPSAMMEVISDHFKYVSLLDGEVFKGSGISVVQLASPSYIQQDLFGESVRSKARDISKLLTGVKQKYGQETLMLGSSYASSKIRLQKRTEQTASAFYIRGLPFPYLGEVL